MSRTQMTTKPTVLVDQFMGNTFQSVSGDNENSTLPASTDFIIDNVLEIGATGSLEIPSTTSLEVAAYISQSDQDIPGKTLHDTYIGDVFDNQSATVRNITLDPNKDFMVPESMEIGPASTLEIPATSSMEILTYGSAKNTNDTQMYFANGAFDYIESGCVWTADAAGSTQNGSMQGGYVWISGKRLTVANIQAHTFGNSIDAYVDFFDNGDGTAKVVFTEVTNNTNPSPTLNAGGLRNAIVVTGASSIAAASSINQGQRDRVLPISSSIPYCKTDSIGNIICPRDPQRRELAYRQCIADVTTTTSADITGCNLNVIIPANRDIEIMAFIGQASSSVINDAVAVQIQDVTAGAQLAEGIGNTDASGDQTTVTAFAVSSAGGTRNLKLILVMAGNASTAHTNSSATNPTFIQVKLI